jgi:hypothetical protein
MEYMHYEWYSLQETDVIQISLDKQAHVRLLDNTNYHRYKSGDSFDFRGGLQVKSPARLSPPRSGHWHLVVDLRGYVGSVRVSVKVLRRYDSPE